MRAARERLTPRLRCGGEARRIQVEEDPAFDRLLAELQAWWSRTPGAAERVAAAYAAGRPILRSLAQTLSEAERREAVSEAKLTRHGLSPQQAKVVACLVNGGTVQSCARSLGIAESTVRSHLKAVFWKTGITRQAHLGSLYGPQPDDAR